MAQTLDTLVTEYKLRDNYTAAAKSISAQTRQLGNEIQNIVGGIGKMGAALAVAGVGGLIALGAAAVKAASDYEQLVVTLETLSGSAEKTRQKLEFIKKLDIPATQGFDALSQAGVQLEAFGLRIEKVLPLVTKLSAAFPTKDIQEAVRLFGRLAQGDFPDIEALSGFGLSKSQFREKGIEFDGQGKLLSGARQTMQALEIIVNEKYGDILDKMANTTNSKLASLQSRWQEALRQLGRALQVALVPILEKLTGFLDNITKNNGLEKWLKQSAIHWLKWGVTISTVVTLALTLATAIAALSKNVIATIKFGAMLAGMSALTHELAVKLHEAQKPAAWWDRLMEGMKSANAWSGGGVPKDPNPEEGWGKISEQAESAKQTARNTREIALQLSDFGKDLRRFVVGGGPLASVGVTPVEMNMFRNAPGARSAKTIRIKWEGAGKLEDYLTDLIEEAVVQAARQGLITIN